MKISQDTLGQEICRAAQEIFTTMIMMEVQPVLEKVESLELPESNISAMIGLGGDIRGILTLHFPESLAVRITSNFLGMEIAEIDEDVKDAIGELANMMAGDLKVFFAANGIDVELAIPTTVIGKGYRTSGIAKAEQVCVILQCNADSYVTELKYVVNS